MLTQLKQRGRNTREWQGTRLPQSPDIVYEE